MVLMVATSIPLRSNAQTFISLWKGDQRMGLTVGGGHNFTPFDVSVSSGYSLDKEPTSAVIVPCIGLYYGMERNLDGGWSFGYETLISLSKPSTDVSVKKNAGKVFEYTLSALNIKAAEQVYLALALSGDFQLNLGGGLGITAFFKGDANSETSGAPSCGFNRGFGFGLGAVISGGVTYYLSKVFFVKGTFEFTTKPFLSTYDMSVDFGSGNNNDITASFNSGTNIALLATIGFKW